MKKTNNKGFSLVELIVVIAIMAVLIGVLAPTFLKFVERGRKSTDVSNVTNVVTALQTYAADPMVASGDEIGNGAKVTLSTTSAATATLNSDKALTAAGIDLAELKLKSGQWGATSITFNVAVNADGTVKVTCDTDLADGHDILKGQYK